MGVVVDEDGFGVVGGVNVGEFCLVSGCYFV